jgi:hypothetical protein
MFVEVGRKIWTPLSFVQKAMSDKAITLPKQEPKLVRLEAGCRTDLRCSTIAFWTTHCKERLSCALWHLRPPSPKCHSYPSHDNQKVSGWMFPDVS